MHACVAVDAFLKTFVQNNAHVTVNSYDLQWGQTATYLCNSSWDQAIIYSRDSSWG